MRLVRAFECIAWSNCSGDIDSKDSPWFLFKQLLRFVSSKSWIHATADLNSSSSIKDAIKYPSRETLTETGSKCPLLLSTSCTRSRYVSRSRRKGWICSCPSWRSSGWDMGVKRGWPPFELSAMVGENAQCSKADGLLSMQSDHCSFCARELRVRHPVVYLGS